MARVYGWSPTEMREREDAFAALVDKKVIGWTKWARAKLTASARVLVAAGADTPPPSAARVDVNSLAALTNLWQGSVTDELMPALTETYRASARTIATGIAYELPDVLVPPVSDSFAEDYLAKASNRLVGIGQLVWQNIRQELLTGFSLGESTSKLADRVATAGQVSLARANVIARTEVNAASNAGAHQQVLITGLTGTKEWLDTNDARTRCTHRAAGGQIVGLREPFKLGGPDCGVGFAYLQVPGDPTAPPEEIIQCRCSVAYDLSLDDAVLTAAVDFIESEHPRAPDGKFIDVGGEIGRAVDRFDSAISGKSGVAEVPWSTSNEYKSRNLTTWDRSRQRMIDAAHAWVHVSNAKQINSGLRENNGDTSKIDDPEVRGNIDTLDEIMSESHVQSDIVVERGVGDLSSMFGDYADSDMVGLEYIDNGFISTTADPERVDRLADEFRKGGVGSWDKPAKMRILVPKGTPAMAPLERIHEVTLDRGLRYRIVADYGVDDKGIRHLDVEVVQ